MYGDNVALLGIMPYLEILGVEPFFITPSKGPFTDILTKNNYLFEVIPFGHDIYNKNYRIKDWLHFFKGYFNVLRRFKNFRRGIQIAKEFGPSIIHTNCSTSCWGLKISKSLGVIHVMHLREYMDLDHNYEYFPTRNNFIKKLNSPLNYCISITPDIQQYFSKIKNNTVIYDGIFDGEKPEINEKRENLILFVGRLVETKGVEEVIKAFCEIDLQNYKLVIAGSGNHNYVNYLKKIAIAFKKQNDIKFLGYQSDVYSLMQKCKALIVASRFEAFGFITAEAMYNGCLVIGKNLAGTKLQMDIVSNILGPESCIRYNKFSELKTGLSSIISKEAVFSKYRKPLQSFLYDYFNKEKSANQVYNYYSEILLK